MERDAIDDVEALPVPTDAHRITVPKDLSLVYKIYSPAVQSLVFKSEEGRSVFAEAFIEDHRLGTLAELCTMVLAHEYGLNTLSKFAGDLQTERLIYDSIDIETPLELIYSIEDSKFWKRVVLEMTSDYSLKFQDDSFDWKSLGISLKYAELVEECPAEYWPEQKMETLAQLVKDFVWKLHIRKLQPLQDYAFERYLLRDSDTEKSDSTDVSSSTSEEAESINADEEFGEEEQEQEQEGDFQVRIGSKQISDIEQSETQSVLVDSDYERLQILQAEWELFNAKRAEEKQRIIEERKLARRLRREAQQARRDRREEKRNERKEIAMIPKPKTVHVRNVFDLPIDEVEDAESKIIDKRNPALLIEQQKRYDYPPKHCHHIDLRFVRLFDFLEEFSIIFHPPDLQDKYHKRYFEFSYDDILRLASGIHELDSLRIFRLRESQMDERKLSILTAVLKHMNVEVIDFGYNYLKDDCDEAISELFQNHTNTIKSLELEGNLFNSNVLKRLAFTLRTYDGHLEYLGLARNPLDDTAIHSLCKLLPYMEQVEHLNLSGVKLSPSTLSCCIANELLLQHKRFRKLDLMGVPIDNGSGEQIIKALKENLTIESVECRGCGLPFEIEYEIEVCLRRNRYIVENPYIGDTEKTAQEINEYVRCQKNPVISKVEEALAKKKTCLEYQPDIAERYSVSTIANDTGRRQESSLISDLIEQYEPESPKRVTFDLRDKFVFEPNKFGLEEFYGQVLLPGTPQRYYYLKAKKEHGLCSGGL